MQISKPAILDLLMMHTHNERYIKHIYTFVQSQDNIAGCNGIDNKGDMVG